jgi:uncharacterized protein
MCPKFQVYKDTAGKTRFRLLADNNKIVAVGEAYEKHAGCLKGIGSVQKNCNSAIEDLTIDDNPKLPNPKYEIYKDAAGEFRFKLRASNGEIIAQGEGYESKEDCLNGINVVKESFDGEIEDAYSRDIISESQPSEAEDEPATEESQPKPPVPVIKFQIMEMQPKTDTTEISTMWQIPLMGIQYAVALTLGVANVISGVSHQLKTDTKTSKWESAKLAE